MTTFAVKSWSQVVNGRHFDKFSWKLIIFENQRKKQIASHPSYPAN